jgi:hypothetical protein
MYTLTQSQIKVARDMLIKKQGGVCDICGKGLEEGTYNPPVLDHDHRTGLVRGGVHRNCNTAEGKVRKAARWSGVDATEYIICLGKYLEKHRKFPSKVRYPK